MGGDNGRRRHVVRTAPCPLRCGPPPRQRRRRGRAVLYDGQQRRAYGGAGACPRAGQEGHPGMVGTSAPARHQQPRELRHEDQPCAPGNLQCAGDSPAGHRGTQVHRTPDGRDSGCHRERHHADLPHFRAAQRGASPPPHAERRLHQRPHDEEDPPEQRAGGDGTADRQQPLRVADAAGRPLPPVHPQGAQDLHLAGTVLRA